MKQRNFFCLYLIATMILVMSIMPTYAQEPSQVGYSHDGRNAVEVVGLVEQTGFNVVFAGYVTHIDGIPDEELFAAGTLPFSRGEATALFTFYGTGAAYSRSVLENLTTTAANVTINFYFNDTPLNANFETLDSFQGTTEIAAFSARFQNIINVQEPNVGVFMMYGTTEQQSAEPFTLNGNAYQLGEPGLVGRSENFGQGFRSSTEPLIARYFIVGNIISPLLSQNDN